MVGVILFILLPIVLIVASFWIKPLVKRDEKGTDPFGGSMAAGGMFGGHGLEADERSMPEEEGVRFKLDDVKKRE